MRDCRPGNARRHRLNGQRAASATMGIRPTGQQLMQLLPSLLEGNMRRTWRLPDGLIERLLLRECVLKAT